MANFICKTTSDRSQLNYGVDWIGVLIDLLPSKKRKTRIIAWISVIYKSLWNWYLTFLEYRCSVLFQTSINGQSIVLEKALNTLYDPIDSEIIVENVTSNFATTFLYQRDEQPPVGEAGGYLYQEGETPVPGYPQQYYYQRAEVDLNFDFIVKIPAAKMSILNLQQIAGTVDRYKFDGTTYTIKEY